MDRRSKALEEERVRLLAHYVCDNNVSQARLFVKRWSKADKQIEICTTESDITKAQLRDLGADSLLSHDQAFTQDDLYTAIASSHDGMNARNVYQVATRQVEPFISSLRQSIFNDDDHFKQELEDRNYDVHDSNLMLVNTFIDEQRQLNELAFKELKNQAKLLDAKVVMTQYKKSIDKGKAKKQRVEQLAMDTFIPRTSRKVMKLALPQTSPRHSSFKKPLNISTPSLDTALAKDISKVSLAHSSSKDTLVDDEEHPGNFQHRCVIGPALTGSVKVTLRKNFSITRMINFTIVLKHTKRSCVVQARAVAQAQQMIQMIKNGMVLGNSRIF